MVQLTQKSSVIAETILVSGFVSVLMILYFVGMKNRANMKGYLGFNPVKPVPFMIWQAIMVAFFYGMNYVVSQTSVEEPDFMKFMRDILKTESLSGLVLMLMALVVAAPLFEELMFRGFMYTGLKHSRAGIPGAIIIPSILWSMVHVQYEWIWILMIFFMGVIFTLARYMTGSIYTVIAMHAVNNFLSFVDVIRS
jgi:membrane protease YdiL (CAAX protease family)